MASSPSTSRRPRPARRSSVTPKRRQPPTELDSPAEPSLGRPASSLPFRLTAAGLLMAACGSRTSTIFLEPAPELGGAAGSDGGVSGAANDGAGGAGGWAPGVAGSPVGVAGSVSGGAGEPSMARDGGRDAPRDAPEPFSPS